MDDYEGEQKEGRREGGEGVGALADEVGGGGDALGEGGEDEGGGEAEGEGAEDDAGEVHPPTRRRGPGVQIALCRASQIL